MALQFHEHNRVFVRNHAAASVADAPRPYADMPGAGDFSKLDEQTVRGILSDAEQSLVEEIPLLPAHLYAQFRTNGNRTNFEGLYFKRRSMVFDLLLGECVEGRGRFAEKLCDVVCAILEETSWVVPAHNRQREGGNRLSYAYGQEVDYIDLFSAETGAILSAALYFAGKLLEDFCPTLPERIRYELDRRIFRPFMEHDANHSWTGVDGNRLANWTPWIVSNVLTACLMSPMEKSARFALVERSMVILDRFSGWYNDDGGCDEGASYWDKAGGAYFDALEVLWDLSGGAIDVFSDPLIRAMGRYVQRVCVTPERFLNFADCPVGVKLDYRLLMRIARRTEDAELARFAAGGCDSKPRGFYSAYRIIKNLWESRPADSGQTVQRCDWLEDLQVLVLREQTVTGKGLLLGAKGGHNQEAHNHMDVGSFILYKDGVPVCVDPGVSSYTRKHFSPQRYELWMMQSAYHNLPTVNGVLQGVDRDSFCATDVCFDKQTRTLSMQLRQAWPAEAGIESWKRTLCLDGGEVTVTDEYRLARDSRVSWTLMTTAPVQDVSAAPDGTLTMGLVNTTLTVSRALDVCTQTVELEDSRLREGWGQPVLYRNLFAADGEREGKVVWKFR